MGYYLWAMSCGKPALLPLAVGFEERVAIGVVLDVATKEYLRMPLVGPVGPSQQVHLTGQGSWRTGKFKSCDDVAAASSIRDQHPKGGVSP